MASTLEEVGEFLKVLADGAVVEGPGFEVVGDVVWVG